MKEKKNADHNNQQFMKKKRDEVHFINFITRDWSSTVYEKETDERQYYNFSSYAACCRSSRKKNGNDWK